MLLLSLNDGWWRWRIIVLLIHWIVLRIAAIVIQKASIVNFIQIFAAIDLLVCIGLDDCVQRVRAIQESGLHWLFNKLYLLIIVVVRGSGRRSATATSARAQHTGAVPVAGENALVPGGALGALDQVRYATVALDKVVFRHARIRRAVLHVGRARVAK